MSEAEILPIEPRAEIDALIVDVDGFEGPLDLLLTLARTQKVDLRRIAVLDLARQYLSFVEEARALRIELAADYLVMAAWLAYLKSRLLLPPAPGDDDEVSAEALADHLAFQLERLEAMRRAAAELMAGDRLGRDVFARGAPEVVTSRRRVRQTATLLDLLRAYARARTRDEFRPLALEPRPVMAMEEALSRLRGLIGYGGAWQTLARFLPEGWVADPARRRSAVASHFAAALELVKEGRAEIAQAAPFADIRLRGRDGADDARG